jgi:hypothetical protein
LLQTVRWWFAILVDIFTTPECYVSVDACYALEVSSEPRVESCLVTRTSRQLF